MNKRSIIINGVRAEEFDLICKYQRHILNDLVMLREGCYDIEPYHRPQFKLEHKKYIFKYKIGDLGGKLKYRKIMWRGFYIYTDSRIVKIYIDINNDILV